MRDCRSIQIDTPKQKTSERNLLLGFNTVLILAANVFVRDCLYVPRLYVSVCLCVYVMTTAFADLPICVNAIARIC